jgi:hypothetical protein
MGLRSLGHPRFRVDRLGRGRHGNIEGNRSHPKIFAKIRKSAGDLNAPSEASTNATFSVKIQHPREGPLHKSFIAKRLNAWRPFGPPMQPLKPPKFAPARAPKRFHKWPPRSKVAKGRRKLTLMSLLGRKPLILDAKINFSRHSRQSRSTQAREAPYAFRLGRSTKSAEAENAVPPLGGVIRCTRHLVHTLYLNGKKNYPIFPKLAPIDRVKLT